MLPINYVKRNGEALKRVTAALTGSSAILAAFGHLANFSGIITAGIWSVALGFCFFSAVVSFDILTQPRPANRSRQNLVPCIVLVVACLVGGAAACVPLLRPSEPKPKVAAKAEILTRSDVDIWEPNPGDSVGLCVVVRGRGIIPPGQSWWVAHQRAKNGRGTGIYFAMSEVVQDAQKDRWYAKTFDIGQSQNNNEDYVVKLLAMPAEIGAGYAAVAGQFSVAKFPRELVVQLAEVYVKRAETNC